MGLLISKRLGKPDTADATPKFCAGEGPNGSPKTSSTPTPDALSGSMRQRPGAGGCKKKRRRLGTLGQEAEFNVEAKEAE